MHGKRLDKAVLALGALALITALFAHGESRASTVELSFGLYGGFMPSAGANCHSSDQELYFNSASGLDGINKKLSGYSTKTIDRLTALSGGLRLRAFFFENFFIAVSGNYTQGVAGGRGTTVYNSTPAASPTPTRLKCRYTISFFDAPLTAGIALPFWKDVKILLGGGVAFARGQASNKFESAAFGKREGSFSGWGYPLVLSLEGEYLLSDTVSVGAGIAYYHGGSRTLRDGMGHDGVDFMKIDFTGFRFTAGVSYYFFSF